LLILVSVSGCGRQDARQKREAAEGLSDPDPIVRARAVGEIGRRRPRDEDLLPRVVALADDPDLSVRIEAYLALSRMDTQGMQAVAILAKGLRASEPTQRAAAAEALHFLCRDQPCSLEVLKRAETELKAAENDPDTIVRFQVKDALEVVGRVIRRRDQREKPAAEGRRASREQGPLFAVQAFASDTYSVRAS
jgi:HEAT repeat protein